jgi:glycosyltransferase involved in cell wall biosynthesis
MRGPRARWCACSPRCPATRPLSGSIRGPAGAGTPRWGYRPRRWVDLPNGFPTASWTPEPDTRARRRADRGVPDTAAPFVCAARVDPVKDHETLLAAFAQARNAGADIRLMLVGEGTERAAGPLQRLSAD